MPTNSEIYSVALCTCNGDRHLQEQLDSIALQTRRPDELIICDDLSTDNTRGIIKIFADGATFPVKYYFNEIRLVSTKNFEKAIKLCYGTIIILSDQDDIWYPDRISKIDSTVRGLPNVGLIFSNGNIIDSQGDSLNANLWDSFRFGKEMQNKIINSVGYEIIVRRHVVTGATMAFRSKYNDMILPIPARSIHDNWISLVISLIADVAIIDEPLIKYRQHENQQLGCGPGKLGLLSQFAFFRKQPRKDSRKDVEILVTLRRRLRSLNSSFGVNVRGYDYLDAIITHKQLRVFGRENRIRRFFVLVCELVQGHYHKYSTGFRSFLNDVIN